MLVGHDHLLHDRQALFFEEHVLGAAQADALGAVAAGPDGILRVVGVRPHTQLADFVCPLEQRVQLDFVVEVGILCRQLAEEDLARAAVEADPFAFA